MINDSTAPYVIKDPDAILDYAVDWTGWLSDDSISTALALVTPGLTKVSDGKADGVHTIWLSGGTAGETYTVTSRITTADGRTDDRSFRVLCVTR